ncbi:mycothiol synthase [Humidisolicoccus flavus]|uniref:mycothiol synthase n=1 Tax=Humidisolicoccus flavus TaxID=3111414 RepID=UPI00324951AA
MSDVDWAALRELIERARESDGAAPFNDQALIEAERDEREVILRAHAAAIVSSSAALPEIEFVVDPGHRGNGIGASMLRDLDQRFPHFSAWAHGDHPASRALAARFGLSPVRTLLQLEAPVVPGQCSSEVRAFTDADAQTWVSANAAAFAEHSEQGKLTLDDFNERRRSGWFSPESLMFVHAPKGTAGLTSSEDAGVGGFAWLKDESPESEEIELYAIGVLPEMQGHGLGRVLMNAAFARAHELGKTTMTLYVEGDNTAALALYRSQGFKDFQKDVRYER